jgi:hypothetical protein
MWVWVWDLLGPYMCIVLNVLYICNWVIMWVWEYGSFQVPTCVYFGRGAKPGHVCARVCLYMQCAYICIVPIYALYKCNQVIVWGWVWDLVVLTCGYSGRGAKQGTMGICMFCQSMLLTMWTCMYVYMREYMYICMCVWAYLCKHFVCVCVLITMWVCTYVRVSINLVYTFIFCACKRAGRCVCVCVCACVCLCVCACLREGYVSVSGGTGTC